MWGKWPRGKWPQDLLHNWSNSVAVGLRTWLVRTDPYIGGFKVSLRKPYRNSSCCCWSCLIRSQHFFLRGNRAGRQFEHVRIFFILGNSSRYYLDQNFVFISFFFQDQQNEDQLNILIKDCINCKVKVVLDWDTRFSTKNGLKLEKLGALSKILCYLSAR